MKFKAIRPIYVPLVLLVAACSAAPIIGSPTTNHAPAPGAVAPRSTGLTMQIGQPKTSQGAGSVYFGVKWPQRSVLSIPEGTVSVSVTAWDASHTTQLATATLVRTGDANGAASRLPQDPNATLAPGLTLFEATAVDYNGHVLGTASSAATVVDDGPTLVYLTFGASSPSPTPTPSDSPSAPPSDLPSPTPTPTATIAMPPSDMPLPTPTPSMFMPPSTIPSDLPSDLPSMPPPSISPSIDVSLPPVMISAPPVVVISMPPVSPP